MIYFKGRCQTFVRLKLFVVYMLFICHSNYIILWSKGCCKLVFISCDFKFQIIILQYINIMNVVVFYFPPECPPDQVHSRPKPRCFYIILGWIVFWLVPSYIIHSNGIQINMIYIRAVLICIKRYILRDF